MSLKDSCLTCLSGLHGLSGLIQSVLYLCVSHEVNSDTQTLRQEGGNSSRNATVAAVRSFKHHYCPDSVNDVVTSGTTNAGNTITSARHR